MKIQSIQRTNDLQAGNTNNYNSPSFQARLGKITISQEFLDTQRWVLTTTDKDSVDVYRGAFAGIELFLKRVKAQLASVDKKPYKVNLNFHGIEPKKNQSYGYGTYVYDAKGTLNELTRSMGVSETWEPVIDEEHAQRGQSVLTSNLLPTEQYKLQNGRWGTKEDYYEDMDEACKDQGMFMAYPDKLSELPDPPQEVERRIVNEGELMIHQPVNVEWSIDVNGHGKEYKIGGFIFDTEKNLSMAEFDTKLVLKSYQRAVDAIETSLVSADDAKAMKKLSKFQYKEPQKNLFKRAGESLQKLFKNKKADQE